MLNYKREPEGTMDDMGKPNFGTSGL
jgi:hypothetical protein